LVFPRSGRKGWEVVGRGGGTTPPPPPPVGCRPPPRKNIVDRIGGQGHVPGQFQNLPDNFRAFAPALPEMYGTHHSKFVLLGYATGMRVVLLTCNHVYSDHYLSTGVCVCVCRCVCVGACEGCEDGAADMQPSLFSSRWCPLCCSCFMGGWVGG